MNAQQVNPITEETQITPWVSGEIDKIYTSFNYEVIPELMKLLEVFEKLLDTAPFEIHDCLKIATDNLQDSSAVLTNTLELC